MAIAYSCPHCGKQLAVGEEYAGRSGPCGACGKQVTVPMASGGASHAAAPAGTGGGAGMGKGCVIAAGVALVLLMFCGGVVAAIVVVNVKAAQAAGRRAKSQNNLKMIALAIHNYEATYRTFPPVYVADVDGKPLYSGRVLLLPFLEQKALYDQFDLNQAWDSLRNLPIGQTVLEVFRDPGSDKERVGETSYLFVTGAGTVFEAGKTVRFADVTDGLSNTLMLVEVKDSGINWAEPRDADLSQRKRLPPGNHEGGNNVAMCDGSIRFIRDTIAEELLRKLVTRNGGEQLDY